MRKMLPTRRTYLLSARLRLDNPGRRHMSSRLRESFACRIEMEQWRAPAEQGARLLNKLLQVLGLAPPEANHGDDNIELVRSLRRTRKQAA